MFCLFSLRACHRTKTANLTFANLSALKASSGDIDGKQESKYAENGKSSKRIKKVLSSQKDCGCHCSRQSGAYLNTCFD